MIIYYNNIFIINVNKSFNIYKFIINNNILYFLYYEY